MGVKLLITPRSYGKHSKRPFEMLKETGLEFRMNPYGRIMTKSEMMQEIQGVDGIIVGVDPLDHEVIAQAKYLKIISKYGVGTDNIDLAASKERGIVVTTADGANTDAVADYTFALMLAVARKVTIIDSQCRNSDWRKITTVDVSNRTLGLIGLGHIGKAVVLRAKGFGMKILAYDSVRDQAFAKANGVHYVPSLEEIMRQSDFISLHLPLNVHTHHIIGHAQFSMMRPTAVIVNTARGGLIDEEAMHDALKNNRIWGAGIDVFAQEPPDHKGLLSLNNIVISSHSAASTVQAIDNMGIIATEHIISYFKQFMEI